MGHDEFLSEAYVALPTGLFYPQDSPEEYAFSAITPYTTTVPQSSSGPKYTAGNVFLRTGWGDGTAESEGDDTSALSSLIPPIPAAAQKAKK